MVSEEQFANFMRQMQSQHFEGLKFLAESLATQKPVGGQAKGNDKAILYEKAFSRVDVFTGEEKKFKEWVFNLTIVVKALSKEAGKWMKEVMVMRDQYVEGEYQRWRANLMSLEEEDLYDKVQGELFGQLCLLTTGEPNTLVRGAEMEDGFVAFRKLIERYDAKSPAKMLRMLLGIIRPEPIKSVKEVPRRLEEWEIKLRDFTSEFKEGGNLGDGIKTAVLLGMLPKELQDEVYRSVQGELNWQAARSRVKAIANNRVSQDLPQPMDIGNIGNEGYGGWGEEEEIQCSPCGGGWWGEEPEVQVDYVGSGVVCLRCGGKGHFARDCGTPKGKGKEGPGKGTKGNMGKGYKGEFGKGFGKGDSKGWKGFGKGDQGKGGWKGGEKGKGKGYPPGLGGGKGVWAGMNSSHIQCYKCGEYGHKSDTCPGSVGEVGLETGGDGQVREIGGVWEIAAVERETGITVVPPAMEKPTVGVVTLKSQETAKEEDHTGKKQKAELGVVTLKSHETAKEEARKTKQKADPGVVTLKSQKDDEAEAKGEETEAEEKKIRAKIWKRKGMGTGKGNGDQEGNSGKRELFIGAVGGGGAKEGEITVDSAAEESVCPKDWRGEFGLHEVERGKEMRLINANGGKIEHYGSRKVVFEPRGVNEVRGKMGMEFQVSDVRKPLAAVWRIAEKGNVVQFGPREGDNYIQNIGTGEKIWLKRKGGSYVMEVGFQRRV